MTSELRPAMEVWWKADTAFGAACLGDGRGDQAAAAVIEADREAVRAEQAAELAKWKALAETLAGALGKIAPIRVHNGPDYAEVYFADGKTHATQAMTMNPQDWIDLSEALREYKEARDAS